ncbi:smoothelin-like protein 1, partial [Actinia tenebrosa]|uniref:Smoothelin-like protein 1 n=1 Tax=Actinia tenebrosa TaxID=6105 RepID=A0A6P8HI63_ACTTE
MSKRGTVADRMAFFRQALETEEKKEHAPKRPSMSAKKKVLSSSTNYSSTSTKPQAKQENGEQVKTTESTTKKVEKVASQRKEPRVLKKKPELKRQKSVSSLVLAWCQDVTREYKGVNIQNFSGSFNNGLAFCALIHKFHPDKFDFDSLDAENREYNVQLAIEVGT